ncbi:MAG TPA: hypothetical protein VFW05_15305 [Verrucomicrobiae bacterium]|nr:hypothetical protein [Verrucomicrobiae bacterium]
MVKNVLTHIGGIGLYGVVSIILFVSVFTAVLIWLLMVKKPYCQAMQALPLEDENRAAAERRSRRGQVAPAIPEKFKR